MKREVAVKNTGNFRRVCPIKRAPVFRLNENISVWDIAPRAVSIQTQQMRIRWPVKPAFHTGERKRPAWCSPEPRISYGLRT